MAKRQCPACRQWEALRSTGRQADYEAAGEFMPQMRISPLFPLMEV